MNHDELSGCYGKHPFKSKQDASKAMARTNRKRDKALSLYTCRDCGHIHVGASTTKLGKHS